MNEQDLEQLTLFQEDFPASPSVWLESKKVKGTIVTSGRKCSELSESLSRVGSSVKTYLESSRLPGKQFVRTWSVRDTLSPYLILKLRLSEHRTEETGCSLWRNPDAHCDRGASSEKRMMMKVEEGLPISLNDQVTHPEMMWPTPRAGRAGRTCKEYNKDRGADLEVTMAKLDSSTIGGQLNPTWVEALMGFPTSWTELEE